MPSRKPLQASPFLLPPAPTPSSSFFTFTVPEPASSPSSPSPYPPSPPWLATLTCHPLSHPLPLTSFHIPSTLLPPTTSSVSLPFPSSSSLPPLSHFSPRSPPPSTSRDVLSELFLPPSLFLRCQVVSGGWWEVDCPDSGRRVLARAFARRLEGDPSRADLSPSLLFHLTSPLPHLRSLAPTCQARVRPYAPALPPPAPSISLARVSSPTSSPFARYDAALTHFFAQRRVLCPLQVIAVPLGSEPSFLQADYDAAKDAPPPPDAEAEDTDTDPSDSLPSPSPAVVFFRVSAPSPSPSPSDPPAPYLVVEPGVTAISTEGSVNSPAPYSLLPYLLRDPSPPLDGRLLACPPLAAHLCALVDLTRPALDPSSSSLSLLLQAPAQSLTPQLLQSVAAVLGLHYYPLSLYDIIGGPSPASQPSGQAAAWAVPYGWVMAAVTQCAPCLVHLTDAAALPKLPAHLPSPLPLLRLLLASALTVADVPSYDATPSPLKPLFTHQFDATAFPREDRVAVVEEALTWVGGVDAEELQEMAHTLGEKTAGLSVGEVVTVMKEAVRLGRKRWAEEDERHRSALQQRLRLSSPASAAPIPAPLILQPFALILADLLAALSAFTARTAAQAGTIASTPTTRWSDIGGLEAAKREINDIIQLPLLHPHLFSSPSSSTSSTKRRGGLLLYGPPGTGQNDNAYASIICTAV